MRVLGGCLFALPIKPALRAPQLLFKKKEKEKEHHNFLSNHSNYTILLIIILFIFTFILFSFSMPTDYFYTTLYFLASLLKLWFISWLRLIIEFNSIIGPFTFTYTLILCHKSFDLLCCLWPHLFFKFPHLMSSLLYPTIVQQRI